MSALQKDCINNESAAASDFMTIKAIIVGVIASAVVLAMGLMSARCDAQTCDKS